MKNIKVKIIDSNTLELEESGSVGDQIELNRIDSIDTSFVSHIIEKEYRQKLLEELQKAHSDDEQIKKTALAEAEIKAQAEIAKLNSAINSFNAEKQNAVLRREHELETVYNKTVADLNAEISRLKNDIGNSRKEQELALTKQDVSYKEREQNYISKISSFELEKSNAVLKTENKLKEQYNKSLEDSQNKIIELNRQLDNLKLQKSSLSVKSIGESLEHFCDNEMTNLMQNGMDNCTWIKDNDVIKGEGDTKGNKADFIFKVYDSERREKELSSVCLDMKDEDPQSINKKKNKDYFRQLDKNRQLKGCEYAVLVSNLETDNLSLPFIYKSQEYPNMYVVRPQYLTVFLNMIVSLTKRYRSLIMQKTEEGIKLKTVNDFIDDFTQLKARYLDKPLELLRKQVGVIGEKCQSIKKYADDIIGATDSINKSYIEQINEKLNKFAVVEKKLEKAN